MRVSWGLSRAGLPLWALSPMEGIFRNLSSLEGEEIAAALTSLRQEGLGLTGTLDLPRDASGSETSFSGTDALLDAEPLASPRSKSVV